MKKKTHADNMGAGQNSNDVRRVYPAPNAKSNPNETIHKQAINGVMLYRNHDGCVIHAEATS